MSSSKDAVYFLTREDMIQHVEDGQQTASAQQQAFNPETKEINWDCPCLGDLPKGPCGDRFKTAFRCFIFSEAEPKGADCIDAFAAMKQCFTQFPEYYTDQLKDDDDAPTATAAPAQTDYTMNAST